MASASIWAQAADMLGDDPRRRPEKRPTISQAARECRPGEVLPARDSRGAEVAVYAVDDGSVYAVADRCPHDGGPLSTGFVEAGRLVCARHGWEFDGQTGELAVPCRARAAGICPRQVRKPRVS